MGIKMEDCPINLLVHSWLALRLVYRLEFAWTFHFVDRKEAILHLFGEIHAQVELDHFFTVIVFFLADHHLNLA